MALSIELTHPISHHYLAVLGLEPQLPFHPLFSTLLTVLSNCEAILSLSHKSSMTHSGWDA